MYPAIDFTDIIFKAWREYDPARAIRSIVDISVKVSTNHVFSIRFDDGSFLFAKCSYFGKYEHFREDHQIINALANSLPPPYENFLSHSLTKDGQVFTFRYQDGIVDVWVVFYYPIPVANRPPRRLSDEQVALLGCELARFHRACSRVKEDLPASSKTLTSDIQALLAILDTSHGQFEHRGHLDAIREQCDRFLECSEPLGFRRFNTLPVFVDWNIGNFSVTSDFKFHSRWDYDWFRMSSRIMDFYFFSRVSSDAGDRTAFSYLVDPLMEDRFLIFLQAYHKEYPLIANEVLFMREAYRFFILNYVIKYGSYFFHPIYASRLMQEAYEVYFPQLERRFNADRILKTLNL